MEFLPEFKCSTSYSLTQLFLFLIILGFLIQCKGRSPSITFQSETAQELFLKYEENSLAIDVEEDSINRLGYHFLSKGNLVDAKEVFKLNTVLYPHSFNVFDSYGECLLALKDTSSSIDNYQKSLQLNSRNDNAYLKLQEIDEARKYGNLSLPEYTFESFWQFFEKNYAHFELKSIDWKKLYDQHRKEINESTQDSILFEVLIGMLQEFRDIHVTLEANDDQYYEAIKQVSIIEELVKARDVLFPNNEYSITRRYFDVVDSTLYKRGFDALKTLGAINEKLPWISYSTNDQYGYLRTISFMPLESHEEQLEILDSIFYSFREMEGLIVDLRLNNGGYDLAALRLMGKMVNQRLLGYQKQNRRGGYGEFDELENIYIEPVGTYRFARKIIVLINGRTVSAGEMIPLGMSQLDNVLIMGSPTYGSLSDIMYKTLPNGWVASLSNERYYDVEKGLNYEDVGIPVDIEMHNTAEDIINMDDSVLNRAMGVFNSWNFKN